jgi:signal transduction histidine kinase
MFSCDKRSVLVVHKIVLQMSSQMLLDDFITANREEIIRRARQKGGVRSMLRLTDAKLDEGIPLFLERLSVTLKSISLGDVATMDASEYGADLYRMGFTVAQVVYGYGDVCQSVTELALEKNASIGVDDFRRFNRCLDDSIAEAVTEYERRRDQTVSLAGAAAGTQRVAVLAHELRNALQTAMLAFGVLKLGAVGTDSSTATLLTRSLNRLHQILERSLAEVRLESENPEHVRIAISDLIEDTEIASALEAVDRGVTFSVFFEPRLVVEGDPLLLSGALTNLIQNALKFSHRGGHVTLTTRSANGRVLLDVEDECGGLPKGRVDQLFTLFEQQSADRTGLGVGLSVARASVRTMKGEIHVRDLPGKGCIFTIDLPQSA